RTSALQQTITADHLITLQLFIFFFFIDTPPPDIYTLSLHDALPIFLGLADRGLDLGLHVGRDLVLVVLEELLGRVDQGLGLVAEDRKSTRLNSSHLGISYAVFCLKKKRNRKLCLRHSMCTPIISAHS